MNVFEMLGFVFISFMNGFFSLGLIFVLEHLTPKSRIGKVALALAILMNMAFWYVIIDELMVMIAKPN